MSAEQCTGKIMTVLGPIEVEQMGVTLPHEHVLVDFIGAEQVSRDRYDADKAMQVILPYLDQVKKLGLQTFVECTPAYIGQDPVLVKRLAETTGLHMLTNTGYYGGRAGAFLPAHAFRETAEQLAERWVNDWLNGLEGTGIRPGFIKTGVNPASSLSAIDRKLVQAAAGAHLKTGLTIAAHTVAGPVLEELEILRAAGVDPSAFIWVHANGDPDLRRHVAVAELGAWVEFDGVGELVEPDVKRLSNMKEHGLLAHVLLSHDAGWYEPGKPDKVFRGYHCLFERLLPALKKNGFAAAEIEQLTVLNPAKAFAIGIRSLEIPCA
jgi:phosphotriesterase-related protein